VVDYAHPDTDARIIRYQGEESLSVLGGERLGVVDALQRRLIQRPDACGGHDGAGQRSTTRLIDARDASGVARALNGAAAQVAAHRAGESLAAGKPKQAGGDADVASSPFARVDASAHWFRAK
jgi:hypothetical protein